MKQSLPNLAIYKDLQDYVPQYGDFVMWAGWFTTWVGVVCNYDVRTEELAIIFSGVPFVLFTLSEDEQKQETRRVSIDKVKNSTKGVWAVNRYEPKENATVWYI
jgi:hypothetical protein